ncbi:unnamed protein product [Diatraea saccharalis]|uniref:Uncharacterized protein n=1 Tax=Diatraea saccharalis TaxID=40085 RepID=A0A9N9RFE4_9NEOP|nr:unnamed protein product [Diatraea saccharalis]
MRPVLPIMSNKKFIFCFCLAYVARIASPAPAEGFVFPDDRRERKLEPIITPPVLPVLEHLERDPSTLLPNERSNSPRTNTVKPRFGGGFNVRPGNGGLTASVSSSGSFGGASQSASQSFSFGFNNGFSASQSASQAASFGGFGSFSGSQASSQAASFGGSGLSGAASSSSALSGGFGGPTGSQSASSAFGFNSLNGFPHSDTGFNDPVFDIRHRGVPNFPFPTFTGRSKGIGAAAFKSTKFPSQRNGDDFVAVLVSN